MTTSLPRPPDPHDVHDRELIAAYAASDLPTRDTLRAEALLGSCAECATLAADLRIIAAATRRLPAAPIAGRDFRLSQADAARLRGSRWRRLLVPLGGPAWSLRPFAAAFTTIGIAGLLIAIVPFASLAPSSGGARYRNEAAAASDQVKLELGSTNAPGAASPAASSYVAGVVLDGGKTARPLDSRGEQYGAHSLAPSQAPTLEQEASPSPPSAPGLPIMLLSTGFIAVGLALFAVSRRPLRGR